MPSKDKPTNSEDQPKKNNNKLTSDDDYEADYMELEVKQALAANLKKKPSVEDLQLEAEEVSITASEL